MQKFNRYDSREAAGEILASEIEKLNPTAVCLLAIPRGGIQVAEAIADRLEVPITPLVVKKLPAPGSPEYGFGSVTGDGTRVLNEKAVNLLNISDETIEKIAGGVVLEIQHRKELYGGIDDEKISRSNVIIVDDGIATGYSLIAGINTVKKRTPKSVTVAVPVSSYSAYFNIKGMVDNIICPIVSDEDFFAVASYYKEWYDLSEQEIINLLNRYKKRYPG